MKTKKYFGVMVLTAVLSMLTILFLIGCSADSSGEGGNNGNTDGSSGGGDGSGSGGFSATPVTDSNIVGTGMFPTYAVAFGNGKFVAGANAYQMSTSTDGITKLSKK